MESRIDHMCVWIRSTSDPYEKILGSMMMMIYGSVKEPKIDGTMFVQYVVYDACQVKRSWYEPKFVVWYTKVLRRKIISSYVKGWKRAYVLSNLVQNIGIQKTCTMVTKINGHLLCPGIYILWQTCTCTSYSREYYYHLIAYWEETRLNYSKRVKAFDFKHSFIS